jgi:C4-dicarboxylate-specific signal transduction histidine kinase
MKHRVKHNSLSAHLRWFVQLRWIAGAAVVALAAVDWSLLHWHARAPQLAVMGLIILGYNMLLRQLLSKVTGRPALMPLVWGQLLADMTCLTALTLWTGGVHSPVAGFFVFHMVFSSLLLSQRKAFASAVAAILILMTGLVIEHQWPQLLGDRLALLGLCTTLILTVYLANQITRSLQRQRARLLRQNRHIRHMSEQLARTRQAMIQHEKMVALGQMAAGVAHEVANPLASMDSLLQLMIRKPERIQPEKLATLREQIDRINQIVRQMKTFAHPVDMQLQTQDLNQVVDEAIAMVQMDRRWKNIELVKHFDLKAGSLALAPQVLHQVLVNLIINSLDAMEQTPHPRLTVGTQRRDDLCVIEITDNGHGIVPENLDRLFEPFFTTKPVGQGTGLGLSISYSLIQRQGGSISVRSRPHVATTFTVRLPDSRGRERSQSPVASSEKPGP